MVPEHRSGDGDLLQHRVEFQDLLEGFDGLGRVLGVVVDEAEEDISGWRRPGHPAESTGRDQRVAPTFLADPDRSKTLQGQRVRGSLVEDLEVEGGGLLRLVEPGEPEGTVVEVVSFRGHEPPEVVLGLGIPLEPAQAAGRQPQGGGVRRLAFEVPRRRA